MLIIDSHLDLAWNALQWNRNLLDSAYTIRVREVGVPGPGRAQGTVALPELRRGRVALCFATLLARATGRPVPYLDYDTPEQAYAVAHGQLAYYRALEQAGHIRMITGSADLKQHMADWWTWEAAGADAASTPPLGFVISMEGADPILQPAQLEQWRQAGLCLLGPAHYGPCRYAGGTGTDSGLTESGRHLLREMARLGVLLDVTHLSDAAFWQALDIYDGPLLASHQNCRALVPHQRQFDDAQLKAVIARGGVIGAAFDAWMLKPGWVRGVSSVHDVSIAHVVDHMDYICQLAGSSRHAAIGTDLDGGFGREQSPHDLDTIADLQQIPALLAGRGYSEADIAAIMHGNWLRLLYEAWGETDESL
jgi:membrane dipeptidase